MFRRASSIACKIHYNPHRNTNSIGTSAKCRYIIVIGIVIGVLAVRIVVPDQLESSPLILFCYSSTRPTMQSRSQIFGFLESVVVKQSKFDGS